MCILKTAEPSVLKDIKKNHNHIVQLNSLTCDTHHGTTREHICKTTNI